MFTLAFKLRSYCRFTMSVKLVDPLLIGNEDRHRSQAQLKSFRPPRSGWYEKLFAWFLAKCTGSYEAKVAGYKAELFSRLRGGNSKVLEIGIGTGPNLKYYAGDGDLHVYGIDPNQKMEKYAREAAVAAGLPATNFNFIQMVGEALPVSDASMDAVVGTLVLCSVQDVNLTLQEVKRVLKPGGLFIFLEHVAAQDQTALNFFQRILNPFQKFIGDGCYLTRQTGKLISESGFSDVDIKMVSVPNLFVLKPHIYGIARK